MKFYVQAGSPCHITCDGHLVPRAQLTRYAHTFRDISRVGYYFYFELSGYTFRFEREHVKGDADAKLYVQWHDELIRRRCEGADPRDIREAEKMLEALRRHNLVTV